MVVATIEQGTTEYLARILEPGTREPHYFVPSGSYERISMVSIGILKQALHATYGMDVHIVTEETFQATVTARRGTT